jgi:phage shock protein C
MKLDTSNKMLFGVCSGIAKSMNFDVVWIRLAFLLLTLMGFGIPLIIYIILAFITPAE